MPRSRTAACALASLLPLIASCAGGTGPDGANLTRAVDIRIADSDEQLLILRNATPEPLELRQGRGGSRKTLAAGETFEIRFRVVSLESHLKVADQNYYFRMAGPVNNRVEEMDGQKYIEAAPGASLIYFRDVFGEGTFALNVEDCEANRWETKQWGSAVHRIDLPYRSDGRTQPVCPIP